MAGKLSNSWALVRSSAAVLKSDKELLAFPVLSGVAVVLVTATFFIPMAILGAGVESIMGEGVASVVGLPLMFLFYLVQYFVIFFFNTALVGAAMIRLDGGDPTVGDGLRIAIAKLPTILGYAAIAATVGMVLKMIAERLGWIGRLVTGFLGMAWSLATFLTVPVLVSQNVTAIDAVKESTAIFKRTWGEQVVGNASLGLIFFLTYVSFFAFWVVGMVLAGMTVPVLVIPMVVLMVAGTLFLALVASAMSGIYSAALYRFAVTGEAGTHFDPAMLEKAFVAKKKRW